MATQQVNKDMNRNPTGKGGFGDHPENRNPGGWKPENSFSYQYKRFMNMTISDLEYWANNTPKDQRTVVEDLAYKRVVAANRSLNDIKEITDRTEGKAPQHLRIGGDGEAPIALVEFVGEGDDTNDIEPAEC